MNRLSLPLLVLVSLFGSGILLEAAEPQLAHMVFFTLADETQEHREQLVAACQQHLSDHEGVVYFSAGWIADDLERDVNDRDFDVALHLVFATKAAHDKYQTHPRHLKFIEENKQLWSRVRVFDSYVPASTLKTIDEVLAAPITVDIDKQALDMHLAFVEIQKKVLESHKVGFPFQITISGKDLQFEGITRNQRIQGFSQRDKSLADVLTALVVHANPVRAVKGPADPDQKLVWVVALDKQSILITTRKAAEARPDKLPEVFRAQ